MLRKDKYALGIYMPRENAIPAFVAILPQAEKRDEEGNQLVPPGMNMIPLPYADDIREPPPFSQAAGSWLYASLLTFAASDEETEAATKLLDTFLRKAPFNPDVFANPALNYHYATLKAVAFGTELPSYDDTIMPDYALITRVRTKTAPC